MDNYLSDIINKFLDDLSWIFEDLAQRLGEAVKDFPHIDADPQNNNE